LYRNFFLTDRHLARPSTASICVHVKKNNRIRQPIRNKRAQRALVAHLRKKSTVKVKPFTEDH